MKTYQFIGYRNTEVLQYIVELLLSHNEELVIRMKEYVNDCENFDLTLEELEQISHEEDLGPEAPSGLEEFSFKTDGSRSYSEWQKTYSETCSWSRRTSLKSLNPCSIIMTYVALPCVASTIMKDLTDPVFLKKLKSKGVTVVQPVFVHGKACTEVSISHCTCCVSRSQLHVHIVIIPIIIQTMFLSSKLS